MNPITLSYCPLVGLWFAVEPRTIEMICDGEYCARPVDVQHVLAYGSDRQDTERRAAVAQQAAEAERWGGRPRKKRKESFSHPAGARNLCTAAGS